MTLDNRLLRKICLAMTLALVGCCLFAIKARSPHLIGIEPQQPEPAQVDASAQVYLAFLKKHHAQGKFEVVNEASVLNESTAVAANVVAVDEAPVADYASMKLGVYVKNGRHQLIMDDELYKAGAWLPTGDKVVKVALSHAILRTKAGKRIRVALAY
jgi:hypothetical protein